MSTETETELRRRWGEDYDKRIGDALDVYETMSDDQRQRVNAGGADDLAALAYLKDPAYTDRKHPKHQQVSEFVQSRFAGLFENDEIIL